MAAGIRQSANCAPGTHALDPSKFGLAGDTARKSADKFRAVKTHYERDQMRNVQSNVCEQ